MATPDLEKIVKVQDFGFLLRKDSDRQAEFLARPSPPRRGGAKCCAP